MDHVKTKLLSVHPVFPPFPVSFPRFLFFLSPPTPPPWIPHCCSSSLHRALSTPWSPVHLLFRSPHPTCDDPFKVCLLCTFRGGRNPPGGVAFSRRGAQAPAAAGIDEGAPSFPGDARPGIDGCQGFSSQQFMAFLSLRTPAATSAHRVQGPPWGLERSQPSSRGDGLWEVEICWF